ncbi:MAG: alpha/beta hydrolase [Anaerolineae bacterium]|nr:alpha/beta hydrolase [Anaerolineae bacterium]
MAPHYAIDKTLTVNNLRFHYRDWGGHGWPLLLLHGLAGTSHIWDLVAPLLVEDAKVIALDIRGHGQSDKPENGYDFKGIAGDVIGAADSLQIERPVIVGHRWGAMLGLWIAANKPGFLGGLVMVDGGLVDMSKQMSWEETLKRLSPPKFDGMEVEEFRARIIERTPQGLLTPAVEAALLSNFEIDADNRIHPRLPPAYHEQILRSMWEQHVTEQFAKVDCPTLILPVRWKGKDDPARLALKEQGAAQAEDLIADVEVTWLEDTVHEVPIQRPHLLAEHIQRFLRERL